jgi:hypothetical protein
LRGEPALRVWREHRELTQELPVFAADTRTQSQSARKER